MPKSSVKTGGERVWSQMFFKYFLLLAFGYLFAKIMWPFIGSFVFAVFFAVIFYPVFEWGKKKVGATASAVGTLVLTLIFILGPLGLLVGLVAKESVRIVGATDVSDVMKVVERFDNYEIFGYRVDIADLSLKVQDGLQSLGAVALDISKAVGAETLRISFGFFVFLFLYFYFLRDGKELLKKSVALLPFSKTQNKRLIGDLHKVSKAVFVGNLLGAVFSGVAAYVGFWAFGVGGAVIWALLAGILSLVPSIGTLVVYAVGAIVVGVLSGLWWAVGFVAYFLAIELGLVQGLIKPKFLDDKISVHPVLVFFALVGGVEAFGSVGLIYGPLVVVLFVAIFEFVTEGD